MCARVSPCAYVFSLVGVFVYGEGCAWVELKAFLCVIIKLGIMEMLV